MKSSSRAGALFGLFLLALVLRLAAVDHGMPRGYVPDNHVVRNALGMARDKDPVPPVGKYSTYPYLVPYLLLPVYAAEYAVGRSSGAWSGADEFGRRAMERPGLVQVPARVLVAVFGALTVLAVWAAARRAGLQTGAVFAGWLVATGLLHVQFSTQERPWVVLVFFGALVAWSAVSYATSGRALHLVLGGVFAALSFGAHQAGLFFAGLPALAWLFGPLGWRGEDLRRRLGQGAACAALFLVVALVGHPYYVRYGLVPQDAVVGGEASRGAVAIGGQALNLGVSLESLERLTRVFFGYDPVLVVLLVAGLVPAMLRKELRATAVFVVVAAAFFLTQPSDHVRYLLPVAVLGALPAGLFAERMFRHELAAGAVLLMLALPLVQAGRFVWLLRQEDMRAEAERALATVPPETPVAIDHYGPILDLSRPALERISELRGELRTREAHRLALLETGLIGRGIDAIPVEELFAVDPGTGEYGVRERLRDRGETPAELLASLGVRHLLLVQRRAAGEEFEPLARLAADGRELMEFNPGITGEVPEESFLPLEMDFPLTGLWQVRRPGPYMVLVEL